MNQTLLEIYRKNLRSNNYKFLNALNIDSTDILKRKIEYWTKDSKKVIIEIFDENICFIYKEFTFQSE